MNITDEVVKDKKIFEAVREFSISNTTSYDNRESLQRITDRRNGKTFSFSEHIKGLIYAQLSNQTKWAQIEPHLNQIDTVFFQYDKDELLGKPGEYFSDRIFELKCGNIATKKQMKHLHYNIHLLEQFEKEFGSIDEYVTSKPPNQIAKELSSETSNRKLKYIGPALAWEYLRNVGVDGAKPDVHMKRIFGSERLGYSLQAVASDEDVCNAVSRISVNNENAMHMEIDLLLWNLCAEGYGSICGATPKCFKCPIQQYCNLGNDKQQ
jgi:endonuclease III